MVLDDDFQVINRREIKPEDRLFRIWVGILASDGKDMVRRRSLILSAGANPLELFWSHFRDGTPRYAAAWEDGKPGEPCVTSPIHEGWGHMHFVEGDSVALRWTITME